MKSVPGLDLQQAVDRVVEIIEADPSKERVDKIITRRIKRHLSRLGAEVGLERLNSLVEDRDMLAENIENLVKKERLEGMLAGRQEGEHMKAERIARNLIAMGLLADANESESVVRQEIRDLARSGKPNAHAFQGIPGGETR